MEARKIVVVSTTSQKKNVIMSAATTLAELKADLRQNNIEYEGMTFYEGTSKTELKDNNSVLPHDVPYKGQITNELVFMLTTPNKKIKSGADMDRSEIYIIIKTHGLQGECIRRFGKNFTQCKTADLIDLIREDSAKEVPTAKCTKEDSDHVDNAARATINILVNTLCLKDILSTEEAEMLTYRLDTTEGIKSSYSDSEINDMFDFAPTDAE